MPLVTSKPLPVTVTLSPLDSPVVLETDRCGVVLASGGPAALRFGPVLVAGLDALLVALGVFAAFDACAVGLAEVVVPAVADRVAEVASRSGVPAPEGAIVDAGELVP